MEHIVLSPLLVPIPQATTGAPSRAIVKSAIGVDTGVVCVASDRTVLLLEHISRSPSKGGKGRKMLVAATGLVLGLPPPIHLISSHHPRLGCYCLEGNSRYMFCLESPMRSDEIVIPAAKSGGTFTSGLTVPVADGAAEVSLMCAEVGKRETSEIVPDAEGAECSFGSFVPRNGFWHGCVTDSAFLHTSVSGHGRLIVFAGT
jgi:hypothetical protein